MLGDEPVDEPPDAQVNLRNHVGNHLRIIEKVEQLMNEVDDDLVDPLSESFKIKIFGACNEFRKVSPNCPKEKCAYGGSKACP